VNAPPQSPSRQTLWHLSSSGKYLTTWINNLFEGPTVFGKIEVIFFTSLLGLWTCHRTTKARCILCESYSKEMKRSYLYMYANLPETYIKDLWDKLDKMQPGN